MVVDQVILVFKVHPGLNVVQNFKQFFHDDCVLSLLLFFWMGKQVEG